MLHLLSDGLVNEATDQWNMGSTAGIIAVTFGIVEVLKKYVKPTTPYIGKIPTWVFPITIAVLLALAANKIITVQGQPILAGDTWVVLGRAFMAAASSSGLFSMIKNSKTTLGESQTLASSMKPSEDQTMTPE